MVVLGGGAESYERGTPVINISLTGRVGKNQCLCLMAGCASRMKTDFVFRIGQQNSLHRTIFTSDVQVVLFPNIFISITILSDTIFLLISFRKSTSPQDRQQDLSTSNSEQRVDDFMEELTF